MKGNFVLKGQICYSKSAQELITVENGYVVCKDGCSEGVFTELPAEYRSYPLVDYGNQMIMPGLVDLHVHAPQYNFRSLDMDLELLEWLEKMTFPEEARYSDPEYARESYRIFVEDLKRGAATRACIFGTLHREATLCLMDLLEESGLRTMVGKVNMDRNCPDILREADARTAAEDTELWLSQVRGRYERTQPIITPRFIPTCSDELMEKLGQIAKEQGLPLQSHLSENQGEIAWVKELCPWSEFYGDAYDHFGAFGGQVKTIMAHCVWSGEEEMERMKERGVFVAHCPESNVNLSSGIAPIRTYLERGIKAGLGSDIAGGTRESIFFAMADAIRMSKMRWRLVDNTRAPLKVEEAFFLGTKGGGEFFGKVGSFEPGYEMDALVLDDSSIKSLRSFTLKERLERIIYLSVDEHIKAKYVAGEQVF